jgi:hypothetical protein
MTSLARRVLFALAPFIVRVPSTVNVPEPTSTLALVPFAVELLMMAFPVTLRLFPFSNSPPVEAAPTMVRLADVAEARSSVTIRSLRICTLSVAPGVELAGPPVKPVVDHVLTSLQLPVWRL